MHNGYHVRLGHPADFRVAYRFYDQKEGGRKSIPGQGYRSDFWYEFEGPYVTSIFMIWPEFEDPNGELIAETGVPVESSGTARMWVLIPERREFHRERIHVGLKAYFMEGSRKVAECTVIEILGLHSNPTVSSI
ncbi:MAG: hypothetical protein H7Y27_07695 [Gemmatimonadaceae bacterium]|nr:hypothetical protein [Chitinophagaceae bacterium]